MKHTLRFPIAGCWFAPPLFEMAGLGEKAALLPSVGLGITNLSFKMESRLGTISLLIWHAGTATESGFEAKKAANHFRCQRATKGEP